MTDLEGAEAFYVGVLGLPVTQRWTDEEGAPRSLWLDLGDGTFLAVEKVSGGAARPDVAPGWHCVALPIAVAERERWRAHLASAGHPVERESDYSLYLRDPEGALVALSHYPERSSATTP